MQDLPPLAHLLADARIAALIAAPAPAFLIDSSGKLRFANRAGLALLGARTLAEAIARGPAALGPLSEAARELIPTLSHAGAPRLEHLRPPDGGFAQPIVFAATRFHLVHEDDAALLVGIDTGRERILEIRLAAAALVDGEHEAFALLDAGGRAIHFNAAAARSPISMPEPPRRWRPPSATASLSPPSASRASRCGASRPALRH